MSGETPIGLNTGLLRQTIVETLAKTLNRLEGTEIAVVGMACRFPGAGDVADYWRNLCAGIDSITTLSDEQLETAGVSEAERNQPDYIKAGAFLEEFDRFDAGFFGLTPREAEVMDPQHRLFLECAWTAFEHAGYHVESFPGEVGVFAGARTNSYAFNLAASPDLVREMGAFELGLGNDLAFLTSRLSYLLNLRGPSYAVHTACSTSLVAVHLACQSLLVEECRMALAGGVAVNVPHWTGYHYRPGGILSPDGRCRVFEEGSQGTVFGSGVGLVVLKRLKDALHEGDRIYAVIIGSATNNDGVQKASFTAPSVQGQERVVLDALATAGVSPEAISFIEGHGTGTLLGDPIEVKALTRVFRSVTEEKGFCALGSVKSNFGHLDAAAGIAGLIKAVLALHHKQLPPTVHFEKPNPNIRFEETPFYVNKALAEWETNRLPRRAGVSAFAIGGTNAHLVLEEAPSFTFDRVPRKWSLLPLSARTAGELERAASNLALDLSANPDTNLNDAAHTLQKGRKPFRHRCFVVADTANAAVRRLEDSGWLERCAAYCELQDRPVTFLFPGQGAQYPGMGLGLYRDEPAFHEAVETCCGLFEAHLGMDLRQVLYPEGNEYCPLWSETRIVQPLLFTFEYALAKFWESMGIPPVAMIGHSLGEYVASCLSGVFSLEDAARLVAARGRLMQSLPPGSMLTVSLGEEALGPFLDDTVSLAAVNAVNQCVLAGPEQGLRRVAKRLSEQGVDHRFLEVSHAFHSAAMDAILDDFEREFSGVRLGEPQIPFISNLTGTWIEPGQATDPAYWRRHVRHTVRFAEGMATLLDNPDRLLLEVGPGRILNHLVTRHPGFATGHRMLSSCRHRRESGDDLAYLHEALGRMWLAGVSIDWDGLYRGDRPQRIPLPTYPFQRQRYWIDPTPASDRMAAVSENTRLDPEEWFYEPSWKRSSLAVSASGKGSETPRGILVFCGSGDQGEAVGRLLSDRGHLVVRVEAAPSFGKLAPDRFRVRPANTEDLRALLQELDNAGIAMSHILHCWSPRPGGALTLESYRAAQELGFFNLAALAKALGERGEEAPLRLDVLASGLYSVLADEVPSPELAPLAALCNVLPSEYPFISCRCIDLPITSYGEVEPAAIKQLLAEIETESSEVFIAYRGRHRWLRSYEPIRLAPALSHPPLLRSRGVYLLTGGLGGLGSVFADLLVRRFEARLVLVGRSELPDREGWADWLETHDAEDATSRRIQAFEGLERLGGEVFYGCADVSLRGDMRRLVDRAITRFGTIHGVIHAAGIPGGGMLQVRDRQAMEQVFSPKVEGALVLEELLGGLDLDFIIHFSSITGILGELGQADYSAANAFLDAFARVQAARHPDTFVTSINWDTWKEVGMTLDQVANRRVPPELAVRLRGEMASGLDSEEGKSLFLRILSQASLPRVVVSTRNLGWRLSETRALTKDRILALMEGASGIQRVRPTLKGPFVAPRSETETRIAEIWQELLGIEKVGVQDNFFDLGGHSLLATRLLMRLRKQFDFELTLAGFFEIPTVSELARVIEEGRKEEEEASACEVLDLLSELSEEEAAERLKNWSS